MSIVESKSLLAKLLAEENIAVQHKKTQTAYFDVKQRILVCPILKDMPTELYDLLMGHEVGHALFTPPDGWHNAVANTKSPGFRSYLNVIEDARIERKVKGKFPGIRTSFYRGYKNLFDRDFFGIKGRNLTTLPLIDRINLHFKLGSLVNVSFSDDEMVYIDDINAAETWDDVLRIATELYGAAKEQEAETDNLGSPDEDDMEDFLDDIQEQLSNKDENSDNLLSGDDDSDDSEDGPEYDTEMGGQSGDDSFDDRDPISITDTSFRQREQELVDEQCTPIVYCNVPKFSWDNMIVPHKVVHDAIEAGSKNGYGSDKTYHELFDVSSKEFYDKNTRYINYMVKEFELRKNAKQLSRAAVNKTGELDMKKISKYKFTEDIFRRMTVVPQGKNHGLLLYLDLSGSMIDNMKGTIEQLLILTTFCRKVNIPFEVYGFSDRVESFALTGSITAGNNYKPVSSREANDFIVDNTFHLKQYFSSTMSRTDYNRAVNNMLLIGNMCARRSIHLMTTEQLHGTPLNEAIASSIDMATEFRKKHRLEVLTMMFLTDGEASSHNTAIYDTEGDTRGFSWAAEGAFRYNISITHKPSKASVQIEKYDSFTRGLLLLTKKATQANVIGFFISERNSFKASVRKVINDYCGKMSPVNFDDEMVKARKNKFFPVMNTGFDVYFVIPPGQELEINDIGIDAGPSASKNELKKAFLKSMKSRAVNRVFLSRFCNTLSESL